MYRKHLNKPKMNSMKFRHLASIAMEKWSKEDCLNILKDIRELNRKVAVWVLKKKYNYDISRSSTETVNS